MISTGSEDQTTPSKNTCPNSPRSVYMLNYPIKTRPLTKQFLLKYIHANLYSSLNILPGDFPDATHIRVDIIFNQEKIHKILGLRKLKNYSYITAATKNGKLATGGTQQPNLG